MLLQRLEAKIRGSNSHQSETLITEPPGRGCTYGGKGYIVFTLFRLYRGDQCTYPCFSKISFLPALRSMFFQSLLVHFPKQALVFTCLQCKSSENAVGKGEITRIEQFLFFPQCFLPVWRYFLPFQ